MTTTPNPVQLQPGEDLITLGGGCFWCTEAVFLRVKGVLGVESGYTNGPLASPNYEQVCSGTTGHAEVVRVRFDTQVVSLEDLLQVFFTIHDPTTLNRQGADVGTQYRSGIYYTRPEQLGVIGRSSTRPSAPTAARSSPRSSPKTTTGPPRRITRTTSPTIRSRATARSSSRPRSTSSPRSSRNC